jgi:hypothetical protein
MTALLPDPVWRSARRSRSTGAGTVTTDHAVRGQHTLCGIPIDEHQWADPVGRRCVECTAVPEGHATHHDLIGGDLTYRKLDYWTRRGLVRCVSRGDGSGHRRYWPAEEARVAVLMSRYTAAGVTLKTAECAARNDGWLAPGVRVVLSSDHDDQLDDDSSTVVAH